MLGRCLLEDLGMGTTKEVFQASGSLPWLIHPLSNCNHPWVGHQNPWVNNTIELSPVANIDGSERLYGALSSRSLATSSCLSLVISKPCSRQYPFRCSHAFLIKTASNFCKLKDGGRPPIHFRDEAGIVWLVPDGVMGDPLDGSLGVETDIEAGDISVVFFTEEDGGSCWGDGLESVVLKFAMYLWSRFTKLFGNRIARSAQFKKGFYRDSFLCTCTR